MVRLWKWLGEHHQSIQALAAIFAGLLAIGTIVAVKWQIDAAARLQQQQSARDIYREYLSLSISRPEFAAPDYCKLAASPQFASYESYISYLLYTAEQVQSLGDGWRETIAGEIGVHAAYLCSDNAYQAEDYVPEVAALVDKVIAKQCEAIKPCDDQVDLP